MKFTIKAKDKNTNARRGVLELAHGTVQTPVFMPVGTVGSVKAVSSEDLIALGAEIILGNTYHLNLRPTSEYIVEKFGSLHRFMNWPRNILTDSGGFQVFSLGLRSNVKGEGPQLVKISEEGAEFSSHLNGDKHMFTPERVVDIQRNLGSDIMMPLDVCPEYPATREWIESSMEQTHRWEKRGIDYWQKIKGESEQAYFGIVQGGTFDDLRKISAEYINSLAFDGIAIGGVANGGEGKERMSQAVITAVSCIDEMKPRYLMGVGEPDDLIRSVGQGVDMFDCVLPTRLARHGVAWIGNEIEGFTEIDLAKARWNDDLSAIDAKCDCPACQSGYSRAYIHHLVKEKEITGIRLLTLHNLRLYLGLMERIRKAIEVGTFSEQFAKYL